MKTYNTSPMKKKRDNIDTSIIDFLTSATAKELMHTCADVTDPLSLRKKLSDRCSPSECVAISQQISLRKKAAERFTCANRMLFDTEGLAQATHPILADYHASLFADTDILLDICTGIGSDASAFSRTVQKQYSLDVNPIKSALAKHNITLLGTMQTTTLLVDDFATYTIPDEVTAIFADPSRRDAEKRIIIPDHYSPTVTHILQRAEKKHIAPGKCIIKLSPACDYTSLLNHGRIEVVSYAGEAKEVLFINDTTRCGERRAVLLGSRDNEISQIRYTLTNSGTTRHRITDAKSYLIEPDAAIIRAGLVAEYAEKINATFLDPHIAYLTIDTLPQDCHSPAYKIKTLLPYNIKTIRRYLSNHEITCISVKKRGINQSPEEIQKKLGIKSGSNTTYLFVYRADDKHCALIAERVTQ